jgi:hypothetical protein
MTFKELPAIVKEAFQPEIHPRKKVFFHEYGVKVGQEINTGSYWDGGCITYYRLKRDGVWNFPPSGEYPKFAGSVTMQAGDVLVAYRTPQSFTVYTCKPTE